MKRFIVGACAAALAVVLSATPLSAQTILPFGRADGPGSRIGVSVKDPAATETAKGKPDQAGGVVIDRVEDGSPAARAGFKVGDVVMEFDGERVRSTAQFVRVVRETRPNQPVKATVVRDGRREILDVTPELGRASFDRSAEIVTRLDRPLRNLPFSFERDNTPLNLFVAPASGRLGASIVALDGQLADYFGVKQGALVSSVDADSPAAQAGLRAGDVILAAGGRNVAQPADVTEAIRTAQPGASFELRVMREKKELTLNATLPERERPRTPSERTRI